MNAHRGQAALTMVLLVGGLSVFVGLGLAFLVASFMNTSAGYQASERAAAIAASGVSDALLQLARDKDFASSGYAVAADGYSASVTVTQGIPAAGNATIVSQATVSRYKRKMETVVAIDGETGEATIVRSQFQL